MATTTNFGWETPDDSDLVKDGALAMRTLGNAIDTSLVDLKGGTTGQVLSKTSNTDMDFTWVTTDDTNAIQNAIVDAKGDLISATAADTPARLASSGVNGDVLTVDTTASTGLKWAAPAGSSGPAFRAYRNTSQVSFSGSTWVKVQLNAETFDTDNCFDPTTNYRFTPTKAGYYLFDATIKVGKTGQSRARAAIYKNGTIASQLWSQINTSTDYQYSGSALIYLNGSTDYAELYINDEDPSGRDYKNGETSDGTWMSGIWIRS